MVLTGSVWIFFALKFKKLVHKTDGCAQLSSVSGEHNFPGPSCHCQKIFTVVQKMRTPLSSNA